ncbi:MAG: hydroxypyruvate isomerase family protein [bacterium]
MVRLSVCVEMIFRNMPFLDRIQKVADVGLKAFEFWGWGDKDIPAIARKREEVGLSVAAFSSGRAPLTQPEKHREYIEELRGAIRAARELNCKTLIVTTGNELAGVPREEQHRNIVEALREAAPIVEDAGVTLVLEPLNVLVDHKGYYLSTSGEGFEILDEVGSPNVKLLYDIYHQQITEGNLISTIEGNIGKIGHFHLADVPGRHEPGTGEISYKNVLGRISALGYGGYVGLEYKPSKDHAETLREIIAMVRDI